MSITEALAKSASQSRNLARKKLQQLGIDPDQNSIAIKAQYDTAMLDPSNDTDCDGTGGNGVMTQPSGPAGIFYCIDPINAGRVCVERPDSTDPGNPERVCSDMEFTQGNIKLKMDLDQLIDQPTGFARVGEMLAGVLPQFHYSASSLSRELIKNNHSGFKMIAKSFWDKRPEVKIAPNFVYAGTGSFNLNNMTGQFVSFEDPSHGMPNIVGAGSIDVVAVEQIKAYLNGVGASISQIVFSNANSLQTGIVQLPHPTSIDNLIANMKLIKEGVYKDAFDDSDGDLDKLDELMEKLSDFKNDYYFPDTNGNVYKSPNYILTNNSVIGVKIGVLAGQVNIKVGHLKNYASGWIADNPVNGTLPPNPFTLHADSKLSEISGALPAPCSLLYRCVEMIAESKRDNGEASGKRYLQNVFVD
jgi:hypothetical protein